MAVSGSYIPEFPYKGDQVLISSGRLVFHSKDDSAFIFANKSISLSTTGSVHINAAEKTYINSKEIQLGLNAQERVIKGDTAVDSFRRLYTSLDNFAVAVGGLSETNLKDAVVTIQKASQDLSDVLANLKDRLPDLLSKTTKTL
jgi:hypothetical protein